MEKQIVLILGHLVSDVTEPENTWTSIDFSKIKSTLKESILEHQNQQSLAKNTG